MQSETYYSIIILLAAFISLAFFLVQGHARGLSRSSLALAVTLLVLLGFVMSKALYLSVRFQLVWQRFGWASLWQMDPRSFAMTGALAGSALAALLAAPKGKERADFFNSLALPLALFFVVSRFAEGLLSTGMGRFLQTEALHFVPLGTVNEYEEWYLRLYLLEGLFALPALMYAWRSRAAVPGQRLALTVTLLALPQLLFESLRLSSLKWGFVRAEQLVVVVLGFIILLIALIKGRKEQMPALASWGLPFVYIALTGAAIAVEFMLDDGVGTPLLAYSLMGLVALLMILTVFAAWIILSRAGRRRS